MLRSSTWTPFSTRGGDRWMPASGRSGTAASLVGSFVPLDDGFGHY
jgi:hypothetical protein